MIGIFLFFAEFLMIYLWSSDSLNGVKDLNININRTKEVPSPFKDGLK